ncbi:PAS domain-containing protein [Mucilaginibacter antarcticus]|uniref:PAS domain-containing protein n=1 Tax=Mucilaginibacter antarcticus TaxID=1855725 RepID=UPI00364145E1
MEHTPTYNNLLTEVEHLKSTLKEAEFRLEEANEMLEAIRSGEIDALIVKAPHGHQLYTLKTSDYSYRIFVEQMTTGAVTLNRDGQILYCNSRFAIMTGHPLEKVIGKNFFSFFNNTGEQDCKTLLDGSWENETKAELLLIDRQENEIPVLLSMQTLDLEDGTSMSVIITDLSLQKQQQALLEAKNIALQQARKVADELNANLEQTVRDRTRELYANQERLSRILETMAEGVGIIDTTGRMTYANPMAQKFLAWSLPI